MHPQLCKLAKVHEPPVDKNDPGKVHEYLAFMVTSNDTQTYNNDAGSAYDGSVFIDNTATPMKIVVWGPSSLRVLDAGVPYVAHKATVKFPDGRSMSFNVLRSILTLYVCAFVVGYGREKGPKVDIQAFTVVEPARKPGFRQLFQGIENIDESMVGTDSVSAVGSNVVFSTASDAFDVGTLSHVDGRYFSPQSGNVPFRWTSLEGKLTVRHMYIVMYTFAYV